MKTIGDKSSSVPCDHDFDLGKFNRDFLEFEKENRLFEYEIKGHRFWDYIRYAYVSQHIVLTRFKSGYGLKPVDRSVNSFFRKMRLLLGNLGSLVWSYFRQLLEPPARFDLFFMNYPRMNFMDGKQVNMIVYPFLRHLSRGYRIIMIEPSWGVRQAEKDYGCRVIGSRFFYVIDRFKAKFIRYSREDCELFRKIQEKIRSRFGVSCDIGKAVGKFYSVQLMKYDRYLKLFRKYRPRAVLYIDDGTTKSVLEAAHDLGIPAIELQHGAISPLDHTFHYPDGIPSEMLARTNPDYVFTFGPFWNDRYKTPSRKIDVGFPYFDLMRSRGYPADNNRLRNIVIIGDLVAKESLVAVALELASLLPEYQIFYKLRHEDYPVWRDRYPERFVLQTNIKVIDHDYVPLYEYFSRCSYLVGGSSTSVFEGLAFGLTVFVLAVAWYRDVACLYENSYVFLESDAREIARKIRAGVRPAERLPLEEIFKPGSLRNAESAIASILAGD